MGSCLAIEIARETAEDTGQAMPRLVMIVDKDLCIQDIEGPQLQDGQLCELKSRNGIGALKDLRHVPLYEKPAGLYWI